LLRAESSSTISILFTLPPLNITFFMKIHETEHSFYFCIRSALS